jgi:hypothetical protein
MVEYYSPSSVDFVKSLYKKILRQIWSRVMEPRQIPPHVDTGNLSRFPFGSRHAWWVKARPRDIMNAASDDESIKLKIFQNIAQA